MSGISSFSTDDVSHSAPVNVSVSASGSTSVNVKAGGGGGVSGSGSGSGSGSVGTGFNSTVGLVSTTSQPTVTTKGMNNSKSSTNMRALTGRELVGGIRLLFFEAPVPVPDPGPGPGPDLESSALSVLSPTDQGPGPTVVVTPVPRKLFESTVVFRALVGQSVLKAKVLPSHLVYVTTPSSPPATLIAVGVITLNNASPAFPLNYIYQTDNCTDNLKQRVQYLPAIQSTDEEVLRQYVLSSLPECCSLSYPSPSTLVIFSDPLSGYEDREGGSIQPGHTVTVSYAIIAATTQSSPTTSNTTSASSSFYSTLEADLANYPYPFPASSSFTSTALEGL